MFNSKTLTPKLIIKLGISFLALLVLMAASYVVFTLYFTQKYRQEITQKLNVNLAQHLIDEKFQQAKPFLEDGSVNKALFGDLMHDMMAVNRAIEVYLLNSNGEILYSVVLDHDKPNAPKKHVDLVPVKHFIQSKGERLILGDDPRDANQQAIFSAAAFNQDGNEGYIYIVLESKVEEAVTASLASSYFLKLGFGASLLTLFFTIGVGLIAIWFLTKNTRQIIHTVRRFREGDYDIRIPNAERSDLSVLATQFNDMADTIVENMDAMKSVDRLRRELIANISHDLRTPLAIMNGYIETLHMKQDSLSPEQQQEYLGIVMESSSKLNKMIAQLFEYSKLEANQIEPQKEPFSMLDLAHDMVAKYEILAAKKQIALSVDSGEKLPLVFADISLVERAIQNLLDNAIRHTPEGGIIELVLRASASEVEIRIDDSGPGISLKDQAFIFERFRQAEEGKASKDGAGIGLAIVKKIMDLHNTTIQVVSQPEHGASFRFSLPSVAV
jgi:signal transduction histidine kinase